MRLFAHSNVLIVLAGVQATVEKPPFAETQVEFRKNIALRNNRITSTDCNRSTRRLSMENPHCRFGRTFRRKTTEINKNQQESFFAEFLGWPFDYGPVNDRIGRWSQFTIRLMAEYPKPGLNRRSIHDAQEARRHIYGFPECTLFFRMLSRIGGKLNMCTQKLIKIHMAESLT